MLESIEKLENLPRDIIFDILSRLSVKCLLRFRCVSKQWFTLISDPQSHLKRASRVLLLPLLACPAASSLDADCGVLERLELPFKRPSLGLKFSGSCNGLVCLRFCKDMFLWNPSTRAYKNLPKPRFVHYNFLFGGLGYDSSIDDYKVVRAAVPCHYYITEGIFFESSAIKVEVYTLRSNTWRRIHDLSNVNLIYHQSGYFFNGALHWQMNRGYDTIVSFDFMEDKFLEMLPLPDEGEKNYVNNRLGVLGGCLCMCRRDHPCVGNLELLIMEDYKMKASWTKLMDVPLDTRFGFYEFFVLLCYTKNGEIILKFGGSELVIYNWKENTWRRVSIPKPKGMSQFGASVYMESLVSPSGLQTYKQIQERTIKKRRLG
uniref:F-box domain-containing protein n=1 Tax=Davidia involucrata TaxID=16924 RepID=A0A5B6YSI9_DAVIN